MILKNCIILFFGLVAIPAEGQSSASSVADSLYLLGNYTAAINEYSKNGDQKSSLQIARSYSAIGNTNKAIVQYLDIIHKNDLAIQAKFELGKLYDRLKKNEEAKLVFEQLTDLETNNPEFHFYLGKNQLALLDATSAKSSFNRAIALDSTHLKSIFLLGRQLIKEERIYDALQIIELGLKSVENDVSLINLKALAHYNNDSYKEAAALFARLLELGEKKSFIYKRLGRSELENWNFEEAKEAYRKLEQFFGMEADAYYGLGEVFLKEQQLDSAEVYFKRSIEERRYIFDNEYRSLGRISRLQGKLKSALEYYAKAWEENKLNYLNYYQVCVLADEYYKDPKIKLRYYKRLLSDFEKLPQFLTERAKKRVSELKEEIHFTAE